MCWLLDVEGFHYAVSVKESNPPPQDLLIEDIHF